MALRIPKELKPRVGEMSIYRKGSYWIVEPVSTTSWPKGFFKKIRIKNPNLSRPDQGTHRSFD